MVFEFFDFFYVYDVLVEFGMFVEILEYYYDLYYNVYVINGNVVIVGIEWDGKFFEEIIVGIYDKFVVVQNGIFNNIF